MRGRGNVADKDGMDEVAIDFIKSHSRLSNRAISRVLAIRGINRSVSWVQTHSHKAGSSTAVVVNDERVQMNIADNKKKLVVVSMPVSSTDETLEIALNAPYEEGYYLDRIIDAEAGTIRALYRLRVKVESGYADAVAFVRNNPNLTVERTIAGLAEKGITRGRDWVNRTKKDVC